MHSSGVLQLVPTSIQQSRIPCPHSPCSQPVVRSEAEICWNGCFLVSHSIFLCYADSRQEIVKGWTSLSSQADRNSQQWKHSILVSMSTKWAIEGWILMRCSENWENMCLCSLYSLTRGFTNKYTVSWLWVVFRVGGREGCEEQWVLHWYMPIMIQMARQQIVQGALWSAWHWQWCWYPLLSLGLSPSLFWTTYSVLKVRPRNPTLTCLVTNTAHFRFGRTVILQNACCLMETDLIASSP